MKISIRKRSFLILGIWERYEFFTLFCGVTKISKAILWGTKQCCLKKFGRSHRSKIERKVNRHLEMMNHLNDKSIAWPGATCYLPMHL